ncbi:hypothetical protein WME79_04705 [Sorangium sp. So ce726]|uniref:hypothetical protein n=1 Tax=Sorangium sp. So ce726 TaxID=3133319 RepID=UPI003F5E2333
MSSPRSHLVLVPGFAGFDILGSIVYYSGVTEILRNTDTGPYQGPLSVHCFPNLPTASVDTRAHALLRWLADRFRQGVFYGSAGRGHRDCVHLVGHSTGGRDIKTLMLLLLAETEQKGSVYGVPVERILESICSIQFLSTPHRGTNLAHVLHRRQPLLTSLAKALHWWLRLAGPKDASSAARRAKTLLQAFGQSDGIVRAALDTIEHFHAMPCDDLARAEARGEYFNVLRWLLHVAEDTEAFEDLDPLPLSGKRSREERWSKHGLSARGPGAWPRELAASIKSAKRTRRASLLGAELEEELSAYYEQRGIALRSIVTRAKRDPGGAFLGAFGIFHGITGNIKEPKVVEALGPSCFVPRFDNPTRTESLTPEMNDGIVNCVSMVYPDTKRSFLVDADHADVMGHYRFIAPEDGDGADPKYGGYDLFQSRTTFDQAEFDGLWTSIGQFAMNSDRCAAMARRSPAVSPVEAPAVPLASAPAVSPASAPAVTHFRAEPSDPEGGA